MLRRVVYFFLGLQLPLVNGFFPGVGSKPAQHRLVLLLLADFFLVAAMRTRSLGQWLVGCACDLEPFDETDTIRLPCDRTKGMSLTSVSVAFVQAAQIAGAELSRFKATLARLMGLRAH